ncbi:hypothetical protein HZS55_11490 [Halosimplex rubrum]|uniref:Uncharacterized protein n=1 Tax=Halosimplex rubrum TaxID=869889 RepID=A0A7D5P0A4_9EURY|nr:hypothetical protein [Halosimplex rubrum]QLH77883.1 hypothetical protein HZS55_11490 [Halosimplex rubrum]
MLLPPSGELRERGDHEGHVAERSLYTRAATSGARGKALVALGVAALGYGVYRAMRGNGADVEAVSSAELDGADRSLLAGTVRGAYQVRSTLSV